MKKISIIVLLALLIMGAFIAFPKKDNVPASKFDLSKLNLNLTDIDETFYATSTNRLFVRDFNKMIYVYEIGDNTSRLIDSIPSEANKYIGSSMANTEDGVVYALDKYALIKYDVSGKWSRYIFDGESELLSVSVTDSKVLVRATLKGGLFLVIFESNTNTFSLARIN